MERPGLPCCTAGASTDALSGLLDGDKLTLPLGFPASVAEADAALASSNTVAFAGCAATVGLPILSFEDWHDDALSLDESEDLLRLFRRALREVTLLFGTCLPTSAGSTSTAGLSGG